MVVVIQFWNNLYQIYNHLKLDGLVIQFWNNLYQIYNHPKLDGSGHPILE